MQQDVGARRHLVQNELRRYDDRDLTPSRRDEVAETLTSDERPHLGLVDGCVPRMNQHPAIFPDVFGPEGAIGPSRSDKP
jgi:hypothetical protein